MTELKLRFVSIYFKEVEDRLCDKHFDCFNNDGKEIGCVIMNDNKYYHNCRFYMKAGIGIEKFELNQVVEFMKQFKQLGE
jgi:hypothetical protein